MKKPNLILCGALTLLLTLPSKLLFAQETNHLSKKHLAKNNLASAKAESSQSKKLAREYTQSETYSDNRRDGSYLDVGLGWVERSELNGFDNLESGASFFINGRYQKYGVYIEFPHGSYRQQDTVLSFGYNFYNSEHWSFDIHHSMNHADLTYGFIDSKNSRKISNKRIGGSELGLRVSANFEHNDLQFVLARASGAGGIYAGVWWTRHQQYQNFNFSFSVGAQYRNEKVVQYYYGFNDNQPITGMSEYRGEAGIEFTSQISMSYPISESWVFESFIRHTNLPSGISNSPVLNKDSKSTAAVLVKYVF